ncbi:Caudovirus prohead protease [Variovorax sp. HW608]|uniref:hypothetical protein n=1 Tax=Variovorax sp. HW608 TaxID=1034889 RepID=UPI0008202345|nr:hypothetical protein [Variovorax sp. HW608]SCK49108.1 Caudovirus prohead protease [Variovorax sp. HW608]
MSGADITAALLAPSRRELRDIDEFTTQFAQPAAPAEVEVIKSASGKREGRYRYVISTDQVDLMGDIVVQEGLKAVADRIPAQVDHSGKIRDQIGYWTDIELKGHKTFATLNLFPEGLSRNADLVRAMHEADMPMASSIGFVPDMTEGGFEYIRDEKNEFITGYRFLRSLLVETSVVVVPANPGALSLRSAEFAKRLGMDADRVGQRLRSFVTADASQQLLRGVRVHDLTVRGAAALQRATACLERGAVK